MQVTLNPDWHVPAGDESAERAVQDSRIRGTLEAIYLHGSAIPNRWERSLLWCSRSGGHLRSASGPLWSIIPLNGSPLDGRGGGWTRLGLTIKGDI